MQSTIGCLPKSDHRNPMNRVQMSLYSNISSHSGFRFISTTKIKIPPHKLRMGLSMRGINYSFADDIQAETRFVSGFLHSHWQNRCT